MIQEQNFLIDSHQVRKRQHHEIEDAENDCEEEGNRNEHNFGKVVVDLHKPLFIFDAKCKG